MKHPGEGNAHFNAFLGLYRAYYGEHEAVQDPAVARLWYGIVSQIAAERLSDFVKSLAEYRRASNHKPRLEEAERALNAMKAEKSAKLRQDILAHRGGERCALCDDSGLMLYTVVRSDSGLRLSHDPHEGVLLRHVAACPCDLGRQYSRFGVSDGLIEAIKKQHQWGLAPLAQSRKRSISVLIDDLIKESIEHERKTAAREGDGGTIPVRAAGGGQGGAARADREPDPDGWRSW